MADECRPTDPRIPLDEPLYRALEPALCVDGDQAPYLGFDLPSSSVVRSRYRGPTPPVQPKLPDHQRTAETTARRLPPPATHNDKLWGWRAVDRPEDDDPAHAEIWCQRMSDPEPRGAAKPGSPAAKLALRQALAKSFTLHRTL